MKNFLKTNSYLFVSVTMMICVVLISSFYFYTNYLLKVKLKNLSISFCEIEKKINALSVETINYQIPEFSHDGSLKKYTYTNLYNFTQNSQIISFPLGGYFIDDKTSILLDLSSSYDIDGIEIYEWDLNSDGIFETSNMDGIARVSLAMLPLLQKDNQICQIPVRIKNKKGKFTYGFQQVSFNTCPTYSKILNFPVNPNTDNNSIEENKYGQVIIFDLKEWSYSPEGHCTVMLDGSRFFQQNAVEFIKDEVLYLDNRAFNDRNEVKIAFLFNSCNDYDNKGYRSYNLILKRQ